MAYRSNISTGINQYIYTLDQALVNKYKFRSFPEVMYNPPPITLTQTVTSSIPSAVKISAITTGTTVNTTNFFYSFGDMKRADWDGSTYTGTFPDTLYVKGTSVTTTNSAGNFVVEFTFNGLIIELIEKGLAGKARILIDEGAGYQLISELSQAGGAANGSTYLRKITFPSAITRKIKVEYGGSYFQGVNIGPSDTVNAVSRQLGPKAIFMGDSFTEGTGGDTPHHSFATIASTLLGWNCWPSGVGSTGYLATGTPGRVKFQDRVSHDVIGYSPDIVVLAGGVNDVGSNQTDLRNAVDLLIDTIKTGLPSAKIYVLSNFAVSNIDTSITNTRDTIKASALSRSVPFIDSISGISYKSTGSISGLTTGSWITGSGNTNNIKQESNSSIYTFTDNAHPSLEGHRYIAERLAGELLKVAY